MPVPLLKAARVQARTVSFEVQFHVSARPLTAHGICRRFEDWLDHPVRALRVRGIYGMSRVDQYASGLEEDTQKRNSAPNRGMKVLDDMSAAAAAVCCNGEGAEEAKRGVTARPPEQARAFR